MPPGDPGDGRILPRFAGRVKANVRHTCVQRFAELKATADREKVKAYFQGVVPDKVMGKLDGLLRKFLLEGGFDLPLP